MTQPSDTHRGRILPTGWRVVGRAAEQIAERAAAAAGRLEAGAAADTLYAVQFTMAPTVRGRPTVERVLEAVTDEIRRTWAECPRLLRDEPAERAPSRFGGLSYDVLSEPGREWLGEVVWRAVHPVVAGAPLTTRVLLEERSTFTRLSVLVTANEGPFSVRGYVGAGQAQPGFLRTLRREVMPTWMGSPLAAHVIRNGEVEDFVESVLSPASRDLPVAVLSPLEEGGFVVDPDDLAWDLLGRARLYIIREHRQTFDLSDAVGDRRMSSYWGAVRCYLPGWSRHDDPLDHPLLVADRLADPVMRATWLGELGIWMGTRIKLPPSIQERRAATTAGAANVRRPAGENPPTGPAAGEKGSALHAGGARAADRAGGQLEPGSDGAEAAAGIEPGGARPLNVQPPLSDTTPLLELLIDEVRNVGALVRQLTDEVERLRTLSAVRSSSTGAIERRLGRLEDILESVFPDGRAIVARDARDEEARRDGRSADEERPGDEEGRLPLVEIVHDAAEAHSDALVFLDSAFASAAVSPYEDPERVRAILDAMARVARRRRDGVLGTSIREALADLGIDYRPTIARNTSNRLREQYRFVHRDGDVVEAEEHVVLGNTYDPRRCLRIYFSSRVSNEPRFVIGHVGRHFDVKSST